MTNLLLKMTNKIRKLNGKAKTRNEGVEQLMNRVSDLEYKETVTNTMQSRMSDHMERSIVGYMMSDHLETTRENEGAMEA